MLLYELFAQFSSVAFVHTSHLTSLACRNGRHSANLPFQDLRRIAKVRLDIHSYSLRRCAIMSGKLHGGASM